MDGARVRGVIRESGLTTRVRTHNKSQDSRRESGLTHDESQDSRRESGLTTRVRTHDESQDSRRTHDESQDSRPPPPTRARDVTVPTLGDVGEPTTMVTTTTTTTTTMLTFRARARGAGATSLTSPRATLPISRPRRARRANVRIENLGGFGPNIDAEEIKRRQAEKQKKIDENRRRANAAKGRNASGGGLAFGGRKKFQQTIAGGERARTYAGRTMPNGKKVTVSSKAKTVASKSEQKRSEKKKLFGLF